MIFNMISCKQNDSQELFDIEAIIREFGMSSAIRMRSLQIKY